MTSDEAGKEPKLVPVSLLAAHGFCVVDRSDPPQLWLVLLFVQRVDMS